MNKYKVTFVAGNNLFYFSVSGEDSLDAHKAALKRFSEEWPSNTDQIATVVIDWID